MKITSIDVAGLGRLPPSPGTLHEEIQTAHLGGRGVVDRCETTATESGKDRFRGTADQHHRDGRIDRATAAGKYLSPRLRGRWMPSGYSGADPHRSPDSHPCEPSGREASRPLMSRPIMAHRRERFRPP